MIKRRFYFFHSFIHSFIQFSGDEIADVVNCRNGVVIERFKVGDFWEGFESIKGLFLNNLPTVSFLYLHLVVAVVFVAFLLTVSL